MSAGNNGSVGGRPFFDVSSFFNLSVSSITIGASVVIGFYAVQAII